MIRRLLVAAASLWVARWAALQLAGVAARYRLVPAPRPDPRRPPGWMPPPGT